MPTFFDSEDLVSHMTPDQMRLCMASSQSPQASVRLTLAACVNLAVLKVIRTGVHGLRDHLNTIATVAASEKQTLAVEWREMASQISTAEPHIQLPRLPEFVEWVTEFNSIASAFRL